MLVVFPAPPCVLWARQGKLRPHSSRQGWLLMEGLLYAEQSSS